VPFSGTYAGDIQPIPGSDVIVATAGLTWNTKLIRSENGGQTWSIVHDDLNNHLYVRFHTGDPNVVYAGNKRSDDAGRTFQHLPALVSQGAEIMGMAETRPDTVYALNSTRRTILRSDDRGNTWYEYAQTDWAMRRMDSKPTFLVDPGNENRVYSIDRHGDLAVFDGEVWRSLGVLELAQGGAQGNFVRNVAVDPNYPDIIYAGTNAPGLSFLFRSLDAGLTWEDITGDLPRLGIMGLAVHPITGDVFIGSHTGTRLLAPPYESPDSLYHRLVPEPGSMAAIGAAAVLLLRRNRTRR
jgi:hypothetical protein